MDKRNGIVAGGHRRSRNASQAIVRTEVDQEYAALLGNASIAEQKRIRDEIELEIEKRLNTLAPPNALY